MQSLRWDHPVAKAVGRELARGKVLQRLLQEGFSCQRENRHQPTSRSLRYRRRLCGHCCV